MVQKYFSTFQDTVERSTRTHTQTRNKHIDTLTHSNIFTFVQIYHSRGRIEPGCLMNNIAQNCLSNFAPKIKLLIKKQTNKLSYVTFNINERNLYK